MGVGSSNGLQVEPKGFPNREEEKTQKLFEQICHQLRWRGKQMEQVLLEYLGLSF